MKPIPLFELQALLDRLGISLAAGTLAQARAHALRQLEQRIEPDGSTLNQLRQTLAEAGLQDIQTILLPWQRLDPRCLPALLWFQGDWWLAERLQPGQITLSHHGLASRQCTEEMLYGASVLWLRNPAGHAAGRANDTPANPALRLILRELLRGRGWLAHVAAATLLVNVLAVAGAIFAMQVYDHVVPEPAYATLATLSAVMLLAVALDWLLRTLRARILDSRTAGADQRLSQQVYEHLLHLRLDLQPHSAGTLAAQIGALDSVRQFFSSSIVFGLIDLPLALLFLGLVALIGGPVGWVYASVLPIALLLGMYTRLRLRRLAHRQMQRSHERQGLLVDSIRGAEAIRASHAGRRFAQDWQELSGAIADCTVQQKAWLHFSATTMASLGTLVHVAALAVGVAQIEAGQLSIGGMIACTILGARVIGAISQSMHHLAQWQQVSAALHAVNRLLCLDTERPAGQTMARPEHAPGTLAVEQLRFAFAQSPLQLLNLPQLQFKAGERVLLLGPAGGGKSTLLKVLAGLYRPSEGQVRLGDADLRDIEPQLVSARIGYLPQTVPLFKGTLRSNLALAGTASDASLHETSRALGLDRVVAVSPQGMDMEIGDGGEGLSGGQRQLVGLARVFMARPRIWLLDEPTAALDSEAEARVWQLLKRQLRPEDILIVATHRPAAAMQLATRVIMMQHGEISYDGSPEQMASAFVARASQAANSADGPDHAAAANTAFPIRARRPRRLQPVPLRSSASI